MREMLIMLIKLNPNGDSWENPEMDLTLLTLLTFPQREAKMLLAGEMIIMLNPCSGKSASYAGNVNNVNNANSKWGLLGKFGNGFNIINTINISPLESKMLLAGEMLIMLNPLPDFPKSPKCELTLLTLLTFQKHFLENMDLTLLTLLTFPLWEAKKCFWQGKC